MKKVLKILSLLAVTTMSTACESKVPTLISMDVSDACLLINCNNCTGATEKGANGDSLNTEGLKSGDFHLYKTNENGVTSRVHCKTKRADDDKYYTSESFFAEFEDISDDYFYADLGRWSGKNKYFINKKTGNAIKLADDYSTNDFKWDYSTSTIQYFPQDNDGNIYGCVKSRSTKGSVIAKFTITEKLVKGETIATVDNADPSIFAVDKDGNVAFSKRSGSYFYVAAGKEVKEQDKNNKTFWTGYDGNIYTISNGEIKKITYDKDKDEVVTETIKTYDGLKGKTIAYDRFLYLDALKQVYTYTSDADRNITIYPLCGENMPGEPVIIAGDDLRMIKDFDGEEIPLPQYELSLDCDDDSIYATIKQEQFILSRIDPRDNMKITQTTYDVQYNDGVRMLSNKKMAIVYWGSNPINTPGDGNAYMSVGVYDINSGTLSKQDTFITGNACRSNIVNLKSYKN